jgi:hypothetical protein
MPNNVASAAGEETFKPFIRSPVITDPQPWYNRCFLIPHEVCASPGVGCCGEESFGG